MKKFSWHVRLGLILVLISIIILGIQLLIFQHTKYGYKYTFFLLFQDILFVPIEVLIVTLILNELLKRRERRSKLVKMNMVIGSFFGEMGTRLLGLLSAFDNNRDDIMKFLLIESGWTDDDYRKMREAITTHTYALSGRNSDMIALREFLLAKRDFMLRLLENPNLLEHDTFTDVLWAITHMTEELDLRKDLAALSDSDCDHLSGDIKRAYTLLIIEWLEYVRHLRDHYPYIFSLVVRTNPFNPNAKVEFD